MKRKKWMLGLCFILMLALGPMSGGIAAAEKAPAVVLLVPDSASISSGSTIGIDVYVENVINFYGVQFALEFDPLVLAGVSVVEGAAFTCLGPGDYWVTLDEFSGNQALFAASLVGVAPLSGDLHVATITFRGEDAGTSDLVWDSIILVNNGGSAIPHVSQDGEITVTDSIDISGYAFMQGRTDHSSIDVELVGPMIGTTTTANDGRYEFSGVDAGDYEFLFSHTMYLTTHLQNCSTGAGVDFHPPSVTLVAGDLTGDQNIDIMDLAKLGGCFGGTDPTCDINEDGIVDLFDLVLVGINFGTTGPIVEYCP